MIESSGNNSQQSKKKKKRKNTAPPTTIRGTGSSLSSHKSARHQYKKNYKQRTPTAHNKHTTVVVGSGGNYPFNPPASSSSQQLRDGASTTSAHTTSCQIDSVNSIMALSNGTISTHSSARIGPSQRHNSHQHQHQHHHSDKSFPSNNNGLALQATPTDERALIIKITQQSEENQDEVFKKVAKHRLFPFVKFIVNIDTDKRVRFSREPNTVCGIVLRSSNISLLDNADSFLIPWWNEKIKVIKTEITTHRNNVIKSIKNKFFGECFLF